MKHLLLLAIRIYWKIPTKMHQKCIFRETCSHYVYRITKEQGFLAGLKALRWRNEVCRPGYVVYLSQGRYYLQAVNGEVFEEQDIALTELPPYNKHILDLDHYIVSDSKQFE